MLSWLLSDLSQIPHWCDVPLAIVNFVHQACQAVSGHSRIIFVKKTTPRHFDTRCVNVLFRESDHTALPTASSFSRLDGF